MKCPIFQIIRDILMIQADFKLQCFLKETHKEGETKQYYKILLPELRDVLIINNQILDRREHHVSIYEDQTWSEKHYQSTYHYTGVFCNGSAQIIIHVYFDSNGQFCYIHVKDEKGERIDNLSETDQKNIRNYAESASVQIISSIQAKAAEISQNFEKEFQQDVIKLEEISKKLSQESIEVLNQYVKQLDQCLTHFEKLAKYTYAPRKDMHQIFITAHTSISHRINLLQQPVKDVKGKKQLITHEEANNTFSEELSAVSIVTPCKKSETQQQKMKAIDDEINSLTKIADFSDRIITEYELLHKKAALCDNDDLDTLVFIMTRINKLQVILQKNLIQSAVTGKLDSVKKLVKYVDFIPYTIYFVCVNNGHSDTAIYLIKHYRFNINLYNLICAPVNAPVELMGQTLLLIAIEKDQFTLFKWLLENGANPNLANPNIGLTPLMIAVFKNLYQYAELLFSYRTNPNIGCFTQSLALITDHKGFAEAVLQRGKNNNTGETALHYACKHNLTHFIKLLFANNANPAILNLERMPAYYYLLFRETVPVNQEAMQYFIAKKVDLDMKQPNTQITGLFFACQKNRLEDVRFLVQHGADPNMPTDLLINHFVGADEYSKNKLSQIIENLLRGEHRSRITPLIKAVTRKFEGIVIYLLNQKYVPVTTDNVYNAIQIANICGATNCVKPLMEHYQLLENQKNANSIKMR